MKYKILFFTAFLLFQTGCDSSNSEENTNQNLLYNSETEETNLSENIEENTQTEKESVDISREISSGSDYQVIAWSDLGMHCTDGSDFSVFSILPPYSNLVAQVIKKGDEPEKIKSGISLTYESFYSLEEKVNSNSSSKTNFWDYLSALFGVSAESDTGLTGNRVQSDTPENMSLNVDSGFWEAHGIPTVPENDDGTKNYYPMVRVVAKDSATGETLSETTTVLPVSDEMNCKSCHASGGSDEVKPSAGWENSSDLEADYKLNILKLHDDKHDISPYLEKLAENGYSYETSLYQTVKNGTPILCSACHSSNALGKDGFSGIPSLSRAIHSEHAKIETVNTKETCYKCHPGEETNCFRGAMSGGEIECQSCHGTMSAVSSSSRSPWNDVPDCQSCHHDGERETTAVTDYGTGTLRSTLISDTRFATNSGKTFKESVGHGDLSCSACHGSTHAIYPSTKAEDNLQNERIQGYSGTLSNCASCHEENIYTANGGPHRIHQIGSSWVRNHEDVAERSGTSSCTACHGSDYRGSGLSEMFETRTLDGKTFQKGDKIGCYDCHNGPSGH
ncbi:hypothetical protein ThvES_00003440 [Thiovulum sp. ES]|nr:hypothetical protein ThvES_00003440 [Thiovulum sp. ES]